jgi:uncharacterized protein YrzB (UPF0473 family)
MVILWKTLIKSNLGLIVYKREFFSSLFCMLAKYNKISYNYSYRIGRRFNMKDLETLKITNPEGKEMEIKVITILKKPDNSKSFLLYTFDDKAESVDIYASLIKEENGVNVLDAVTDKEDWDMIQKAIQELSEE